MKARKKEWIRIIVSTSIEIKYAKNGGEMI